MPHPRWALARSLVRSGRFAGLGLAETAARWQHDAGDGRDAGEDARTWAEQAAQGRVGGGGGEQRGQAEAGAADRGLLTAPKAASTTAAAGQMCRTCSHPKNGN